MITVVAELTTKAAPQALIDRIWSGLEWQRGRAGIKGLAIEYDDGRHQSVQVCVGWGAGYMAMSIMRFRDSASRISFFYAAPPQGVVRQTGAWEARAVDDGCRLRLERSLQLQRRRAESDGALQARERAYGSILQEHLGLVLNTVTKQQHAGAEQ